MRADTFAGSQIRVPEGVTTGIAEEFPTGYRVPKQRYPT
ncbi:hypothetical protein JOC94_001938 [Bacillus thermophilus]|uniref:Uncharacterized protein n=1 Tax=Siminovitchia thermophila TaxID=1245522 RepID=A0ABS2R5Q7_9BACI|nr:hypothetical protein [Siminovitchia thermophila]